MLRFVILLLGMLTTRTGRVDRASFRAGQRREWGPPEAADGLGGEMPYGGGPYAEGPWGDDRDDGWVFAAEPAARPLARATHSGGLGGPGGGGRGGTGSGGTGSGGRSHADLASRTLILPRARPRPRVPRWAKWSAALALAGLVFRKTIVFVVLTALSAMLHLIGLNVHLPSIKFSWPWQSIAAGTTTNTDVGPWVLQKIEGITRPALGSENFNFVFTHKVSKSIGFWPCWYASTFYAVGRASATVNLNPGPAWWGPKTGHYELQVLSRPVDGRRGQVAVTMVLPQPQLPQSVHDITVDNTLSKPLDTQHSWTYPGLGCGALIKPQFSESVLYGQAQQLAFYQATHNPQVTHPMIAAAESSAAQIIRYNFIQPTVNALGYTLQRFSLSWARAP